MAMTDDEMYVAWSRSIAELAIDTLAGAKIVTKSEMERAITIAAREIYVRLVAGDRPDRENWRFKLN
jgi:hypothetical protein